MEQREVVLVSAPNALGEQFIRALKRNNIPCAAIANNKSERERLSALGVEKVVIVNTTIGKKRVAIAPEMEIGSVYLFERSVALCCRYIHICRQWTTKPIYVVTESFRPRHVYQGLGADYVIHTKGADVSFLIADALPAKQ